MPVDYQDSDRSLSGGTRAQKAGDFGRRIVPAGATEPPDDDGGLRGGLRQPTLSKSHGSRGRRKSSRFTSNRQLAFPEAILETHHGLLASSQDHACADQGKLGDLSGASRLR